MLPDVMRHIIALEAKVKRLEQQAHPPTSMPIQTAVAALAGTPLHGKALEEVLEAAGLTPRQRVDVTAAVGSIRTKHPTTFEYGDTGVVHVKGSASE